MEEVPVKYDHLLEGRMAEVDEGEEDWMVEVVEDWRVVEEVS